MDVLVDEENALLFKAFFYLLAQPTIAHCTAYSFTYVCSIYIPVYRFICRFLDKCRPIVNYSMLFVLVLLVLQ